MIAFRIHKEQGKFPFVSYELCDIEVCEGKGIGCICEDFASLKIEFIPAYDVVRSVKKENNVSEYEHFIRVCCANGLEEEKVRHFLEYQILTDFLISNTDRHFNNFGVLRDTDTLKFTGMAPIFDSGNSMFWNCPNLPKKSSLLDIQTKSFRKREADMLKYVFNPDLINLDCLPGIKEIRDLLGKDLEI